MRQHRPRPLLHPNTRVAIVRPAGPVDRAPLEQAASHLASLTGWSVSLPPDPTPADDTPPWLADSDAARATALIEACEHAELVWAARGGYGCARLLERLPTDLLRRTSTWLAGFSDITALHLWAATQGVPSIHAANAHGAAALDDPEALASLVALLRMGRGGAVPVRAALPGKARGTLTGGNLTVLASLIGTRWLPSLHDRILLLEDVGEAPYRIDRALTSLLLDGRADGLRGVVLGHFTRCGDREAALQACLERLGPLGIPVVRDAPFGHQAPNRALLLGVPWEIDGDEGRLVPVVQRMVSIQPVRAGADARFAGVCQRIDDAIREGVGSGAQLVVRHGDDVRVDASFGFTSGTELDHALTAHGPVPVRATTRFDLASLTKCLSTAVLAWQAIDEGRVALDTLVPPSIHAEAGALGVTFGDLLGHRSGLPAWQRLYPAARRSTSPASYLRNALAHVSIDPATRGRCVYSDPGYLVLGFWLEALFDQPLAPLFAERVLARIDGAGPRFLPCSPTGAGEGDARRTASRPDAPAVRGGAPMQAELVVATEYCPYRGRILHGTVHDEHAQVLGGAAGHAGLFGSAAEVMAVVDALRSERSPLLSATAREAMWHLDPARADGSFTLGWDTPSGPRSSAGRHMRRDATVGHLGFTGTSVWYDRSRDLRIVLLTNRVHPTRDDGRIRALRAAVHDDVLEALERDLAPGGRPPQEPT